MKVEKCEKCLSTSSELKSHELNQTQLNLTLEKKIGTLKLELSEQQEENRKLEILLSEQHHIIKLALTRIVPQNDKKIKFCEVSFYY